MTTLVAIKGGKDGLRLHLNESAGWSDVIEALRSQLGQGAQFFNGARVIIDIGNRPLTEAQLAELMALMHEHHLEASALASTSRESRSAARAAGVVARPVTRSITAPESPDGALFIWRTVRSGQIVRHHGHVTIVGDVNAGAEVVAGGSVIVWGRVRGIVHAGALGDRTVIIGAIELRPMQLRIADLIARAPDGAAAGHPEVAYIDGDQIAVESWERYRRANRSDL
ncbi:septum site-determining protein MinC [Roseiflexus castenholzii]|uniref:septum site-determining protein MinC n=1 Tax=Roseiflexus castenholzii TaxID=120962 RepID=UPI003C7D21B1